MHLRIQTYGEYWQSADNSRLALTIVPDKVNVQDVLEKGLDDLSDLCDVVIEKFEAARDEYHKTNPP